MGRLRADLRGRQRRPGAGGGAALRDVVPGVVPTLHHSRAPRGRPPQPPAWLPRHGRAPVQGHVGGARAGDARLRRARHRGSPRRDHAPDGRGPSALLDELRWAAAGQDPPIDGAVRPRSVAALPVAAGRAEGTAATATAGPRARSRRGPTNLRLVNRTLTLTTVVALSRLRRTARPDSGTADGGP